MDAMVGGYFAERARRGRAGDEREDRLYADFLAAVST